MDYIKDIFLNLSYSEMWLVTQRVLLFLTASAIVIWLLWIVFVKYLPMVAVTNNRAITTGRKLHLTREAKIKFSFLFALTCYIIVFSIFLYFVIKQNGLHQFRWLEAEFYFSILPHIIALIAVIVTFLIYRYKYYNNLKN